MNAVKYIRRILIGSIPLIAFFAFWEIGSRYIPRGVVPAPSKVAVQMFHEFIRVKPQSNMGGFTLAGHTLESLARIAKGFLLASLVGITAGFLLSTYFKSLQRLFLPFFRICEKLNPFAVIPVFMILFGIGDGEKIAIVFWAAIWPILFNTQEGAKNTDPLLIKAARTMCAGKLKLFTKVIFPAALPSLFTGLKLAIRIAFFMIIASEVVGSTSGVGWWYVQQKVTYKLPLVYGSILFITLLAIIFNGIFTWLEKYALRWKERTF
jgi:NitT/TauT family transport system permease protein